MSDRTLLRLYERFRHICVWRGVLLAGVTLAISMHAVLTQTTPMIARWRGVVWVEGGPAVAIGVAWFGAALALHAQYFWGRVEPVWRFSDLGLLAGLLLMAGGAVGAIGILFAAA